LLYAVKDGGVILHFAGPCGGLAVSMKWGMAFSDISDLEVKCCVMLLLFFSFPPVCSVNQIYNHKSRSLSFVFFTSRRVNRFNLGLVPRPTNVQYLNA